MHSIDVHFTRFRCNLQRLMRIGRTRFQSIAPWLLLLAPVLIPLHGLALGQPQYVETTPDLNSFRLVHQKAAAKLYVDSGDYHGVARAARDLQADIFRVSGCNALISSLRRRSSYRHNRQKQNHRPAHSRTEDRCEPYRG